MIIGKSFLGRVRSTLFFSLLLLIPLHVPCTAQIYTEIVAFGDSYSDMGNNASVRTYDPTKSAYLPVTWVKHLADPSRLNISPFEPSGISGTAVGSNYAYVGAMTQYGVSQGFSGNPYNQNNFTVQVTNRYLNSSFNTGGVKTGDDALHVVFIGGNDLLAGSQKSTYVNARWTNLNSLALNVVSSIEGQIGALAAAGVKNVMWLNLPDLSFTPEMKNKAALFESQSAGAGATYLAALHDASLAFSADMDSAIQRLEGNYTELNIIKVDIYTLMEQIVANPAAYGFTNITDQASQATPYYQYYDDYLFADSIHPTPHAASVIADYAYAALAVPEPSTYVLIVMGLIGIIFIHRKKLILA